ncbi:hypothetical protein CLF_104830 [Clonorchis sinensis]|uniref:Uncharacterized protein n=1 Tax=Clonorchis sinensis TaxID=79923 RepID=G7YP01_CLOSI|nr:hypothetical protein CLF_104830 [Clonorchis sinensis]
MDTSSRGDTETSTVHDIVNMLFIFLKIINELRRSTFILRVSGDSDVTARGIYGVGVAPSRKAESASVDWIPVVFALILGAKAQQFHSSTSKSFSNSRALSGNTVCFGFEKKFCDKEKKTRSKVEGKRIWHPPLMHNVRSHGCSSRGKDGKPAWTNFLLAQRSFQNSINNEHPSKLRQTMRVIFFDSDSQNDSFSGLSYMCYYVDCQTAVEFNRHPSTLNVIGLAVLRLRSAEWCPIEAVACVGTIMYKWADVLVLTQHSIPHGHSIGFGCAIGSVILGVQRFSQMCFLKEIWWNYDLRNNQNLWTSAVSWLIRLLDHSELATCEEFLASHEFPKTVNLSKATDVSASV